VPSEQRESIQPRLVLREELLLSPVAVRSLDASRQIPEDPSPVRTAFQRDRDRIIHTKSFRRLKHKTQVFIDPSGDHYRTRLTHTLEVTQIARTIGRALRLNEDLIEAIGMGHDLGHAPFGHAGETALSSVFPGFRHNEQSLRVVDVLEKDGKGLNLTDAVRDGILRHSKPNEDITGNVSGKPGSLEGEVVKISDGIAYINHDLDDSIRAGLLEQSEIPRGVIEELGVSHAERINTLVCDIVLQSETEIAPGEIRMSMNVERTANTLRGFLFERVYNPLNERPDTLRARHVIEALFGHYCAHLEEMPLEYRSAHEDNSPERLVVDYIASMTDRFAVEQYQQIFVPRYWST
jgi:dGTPase